ncbi:MAG: GTPase HflX [Desulfobacterales bacterium]|nr:GTPase HflX [Desulfobacterales bacterium]
MKKIYGNTKGLKADPLRRLQNLYRRRIPPRFPITSELAREISHLSADIRRQIGLLIDRRGRIDYVLVGNRHGLVIPDLSQYRLAPGRLRGLRCIHTHLGGEGLTEDDLADLAMLRLDMMGAVEVGDDGNPVQVHIGHLMPGDESETGLQIIDPLPPHRLDIGCLDLIQSLEQELSHVREGYRAEEGKERALLVSVSTESRQQARDSLAELRELARSSGIQVIGTVLQQRQKADPRYLMGSGKLRELTIQALQKGATLIVFDQELNPSQIRSITDQVELKVIDRTQLILDIFAQRAQSREGKLQVELAQLQYLLPRLVTKNTAMSRLTGGIGGRGPGETKLEINRRRVRDRIAQLEKSLTNVSRHRHRQRSRRDKRGLPIISIIGYTNAGKSTLLNTLTHSSVLAESRLFATLDPSSRRLRFPRDIEVIITDTVGFIRDLPKELMAAFGATLEELESADLLLHVIDIHNPRLEDQIESVERILSELWLDAVPCLRVLNKQDLIDPEHVAGLAASLGGIPISAIDSKTLAPLIEEMAKIIGRINDPETAASGAFDPCPPDPAGGISG